MWEVLEKGAIPYSNWSEEQAIPRVLEGEVLPKPLSCPDNLFAVMKRCWSANPVVRPTFKQLYSDIKEILVSIDPKASFISRVVVSPKPVELFYETPSDYYKNN